MATFAVSEEKRLRTVTLVVSLRPNTLVTVNDTVQVLMLSESGMVTRSVLARGVERGGSTNVAGIHCQCRAEERMGTETRDSPCHVAVRANTPPPVEAPPSSTSDESHGLTVVEV